MVIHYFFENTKYWTPLLSSPGAIVYRDPNTFIKNPELPKNFRSDTYRSLHPDLENMSDKECECHYLEYGKKENRKVDRSIFPEGFQVSKYRSLHSDLKNMSDKECEQHFIKHGFQENMKYT